MDVGADSSSALAVAEMAIDVSARLGYNAKGNGKNLHGEVAKWP